MSVRSFHSVYVAGTVAAAALGCYLISLRVAAERAALEEVESRIVQTQSDIRMLQTEIGTRGRLDQLEQWNASALSLSAPAADQLLQDSFELAKLTAPEHQLEVKAPVVFASAPAPQPTSTLAGSGDETASGTAAPLPSSQSLVQEASLKIETPGATTQALAASTSATKPKPLAKSVALNKPSARKSVKPVEIAEADPLAPLASGKLRPAHPQHWKDNGRTK